MPGVVQVLRRAALVPRRSLARIETPELGRRPKAIALGNEGVYGRRQDPQSTERMKVENSTRPDPPQRLTYPDPDRQRSF